MSESCDECSMAEVAALRNQRSLNREAICRSAGHIHIHGLHFGMQNLRPTGQYAIQRQSQLSTSGAEFLLGTEREGVSYHLSSNNFHC